MASECSSKFAKVIGKGNLIAVLATMILLSYAKCFNVILSSFSLLYGRPALGSHNVDVARIGNVLTIANEKINHTGFKAIIFFLIAVMILVLLLYAIYTALFFSWQCFYDMKTKSPLSG